MVGKGGGVKERPVPRGRQGRKRLLGYRKFGSLQIVCEHFNIKAIILIGEGEE
jgi:hypothetical protein